MNRLFFLFGTLLTLASVTEASELAQAKDSSIHLAMDGFRVAVKQLQEECEFVSSYRWTRWFPADMNTAMTGPVPDGTGEVYTGVINKRKDVWRISRIPEKPPVDGLATNSAENRGITTVAAPTPLEQLFNREVYFDYNPPWGGQFDSGSLTPFSQNPDILNNGGCVSNAQHLSPLNILPGCNRDIFCAETKELNNYQVEFDLAPIDEEHVLVKTKWSLQLDGTDYSQICETSIWIGPTIPVVKMITVTTTASQKQAIKKQQIEKVAFRDFRKCGNYQLAANVRHGHYTMGFKKMFATDWTSSDLGSRDPIDADFEVAITPRTRIFGIKSNDNERPTTIGPAYLTFDRTLPDGTVIVTKPVTVPESRIGVWWVVVAVIPIVVCGLYYRSRRS